MVASRFDCNVGRLKTPFRAEISTGTVKLMHCLASAEPATKLKAKTDFENMFANYDYWTLTAVPKTRYAENTKTVINASFKYFSQNPAQSSKLGARRPWPMTSSTIETSLVQSHAGSAGRVQKCAGKVALELRC